MLPYAQLLLAPLVACLAYLAGRRMAPTRSWPIPFLLGLLLTVGMMLPRRVPGLAFTPPFVWAADVFLAPPLMAAAIPLLLVPLIYRLPHPRRRPLHLFLALVLAAYAFLPPVAQLVARPTLAQLHTTFDNRGICRQSTPYTCGPAAAVTCLHVLGTPEEEGPLARAALTAPLVGTSMTHLARTLATRHPHLDARCRYLPSLDDLPLPCIADVTLPRIGGHYLAVLAVSSDAVTVGDPLSGRYDLSRDEFLRCWHGTAITFHPAPSR